MTVLGKAFGLGCTALVVLGASWYASQQAVRATRTALAANPALEVGPVAARGFPLGIGVNIRDIAFHSPNGQSDWQAPAITAQAAIWSPLKWRITPDLPVRVMINGLLFRASGIDPRVDLRVGLGSDLPLRGIDLATQDATLTYEPAAAPSLSARAVQVTTTRKDDFMHTLRADITALSFPPGLMAQAVPGARLPDTIDTVTIDGDLGFVGPVALAQPLPPLDAVSLREAKVVWGSRILTAAGDLAIGPDGTPQGMLSIVLNDWQGWLDRAIAAGWIGRDMAPMLGTVAGALAARSPEGTLTLPLTFANGRMALGPVPLGPAPRLR